MKNEEWDIETGQEETERRITLPEEITATVSSSSSSSSFHSSCFLYYLGLGTNLGDKETNLHTAVRELGNRVGEVVSLSSFYATEPWGFVSEHTFLNAAVSIRTSLSPLEVLQRTQKIEQDMGRWHKSAGGVYADRVIDIDLLLCLTPDGKPLHIQTSQLILPHPLMEERDFVMQPLAEIAPEVVQRFFPSFSSKA